jgi:hypothetical protein
LGQTDERSFAIDCHAVTGFSWNWAARQAIFLAGGGTSK